MNLKIPKDYEDYSLAVEEISKTPEKLGCQTFCTESNFIQVCSKGEKCGNYEKSQNYAIDIAMEQHNEGVKETIENSGM